MEVHYSSKTDLWETPQSFFDELNREFHFETDVCALPENAKCDKFYTPDQDGLKQDWSGVCWCNPPYGRQIGKWVEKAAKSDATVVMLLPARTDTKWFHDWILPFAEIRFVKGRLKFGGAAHNAPFPCMVVIFRR
jgi:phage N-6-adenine-methyltransferase